MHASAHRTSSRSRTSRTRSPSTRHRSTRKGGEKTVSRRDGKRKKKSRRPRDHDPYSRTHSEPQYHQAAGVFPPTYTFASAPVPYHPAMGAMYPASYSPYVHPHAAPPPPASGANLGPHTPGYASAPVPLHQQIPLGYPNPYLNRHSSHASLHTSRDDSYVSRSRSKRTKNRLGGHSGPTMSKKHYKSMPGPISTRCRSISPPLSNPHRRPQLNRPISSASQVYGVTSQPISRTLLQRAAIRSPSPSMRSHALPSMSAVQHARAPSSGMIDHSAYTGVASPAMRNGSFAHFAAPYALPSSPEYAAHQSQRATSYTNLRSPHGHRRRRRRRRDNYLSSGSDADSYSDEEDQVLSGEGEEAEEELSSSSEYEYPPGEEPRTLKYNRRSTEERRRIAKRERERERRRPHKQREGRDAGDRPRHRRSRESGREPLNGYASDPNRRDEDRDRRDGDRDLKRDRESARDREWRARESDRTREKHRTPERLGRPPKPQRLSNKNSPRSAQQGTLSEAEERRATSSTESLSRDSNGKKHTKRRERHSSAKSGKSASSAKSGKSASSASKSPRRQTKLVGASSRPHKDSLERAKRRLESQQSENTSKQKHEKAPKTSRNSNTYKGTGGKHSKSKIPNFAKSHSAATAAARKTSSPDTLQRGSLSQKVSIRRSSAPTELKAASASLLNGADSASDENDTDVVDGETAFWDLIESSQITRDGVVNKPKKKPAASMTHPSTCSKESLSRNRERKKVSPASDDSKKTRRDLEREWRRQRKSATMHSQRPSRSVSPSNSKSNSQSLEEPAASHTREPSSSPRSRFFSRRKRSASPATKKYNTMKEKAGGRSFLRNRGRSRHKKTSSLEHLRCIDLTEPTNTSKPSTRSYSAAPRRSPFSSQRKPPVAVDASKLSPRGSEAQGASPRSRNSGGGVRGLLRRLSRDSQGSADLKPEDPADASGASSDHAGPQKPLPSVPPRTATSGSSGSAERLNLRVHSNKGSSDSNNPSTGNELSRSSSTTQHLLPTDAGSSHSRRVSLAAHEPNGSSPVLTPRSPPSSRGARLVPDPSLRAKRAKVVHVPAAVDSTASPAHSRHSSSRYSSLNSPRDISRPRSPLGGSTSSSGRVTLVKMNKGSASNSRRASRDPDMPVLHTSNSAPSEGGSASGVHARHVSTQGSVNVPPNPPAAPAASQGKGRAASSRRPIVTV